MGQQNYASQYSEKIDERFSLGSVTDDAVNKDYDFSDVNKVYVYSVDVTELNDYNALSGTNRYGNPAELTNKVQELELTQDKSFTFTIDTRGVSDEKKTMLAGRCLQREIDEVIVPTIDQYRLSVMADAAETVEQALSNDDVYVAFLNANAALTEKKVPVNGRIAYITPETHVMLKSNQLFVGYGDKAYDASRNNNNNRFDGVEIRVVPSTYLPEDTLMLITHPAATTSPVKLASYIIHENPPGVNGWLVEGRVYYDAFVMNSKKQAIALVKKPGE